MPANHKTEAVDRLIRLLLGVIAVMLVVLLILVIIFFVTKAPKEPSVPVDTAPVGDAVDTVTLPKTPDAGMDYQNSIVFVGESLTAHFIRSEALPGGRDTKQVWRCENNMMNLNSEVTAAKIIYPETGEKMTIAQAAATAKPAVMIITLGIDYGVAYLEEDEFKACYTALVKDIQKASPNTRIILQSIFPVTDFCTKFENTEIDLANTWVKAVAAQNGCRYLDTQSILKDDKNCLNKAYAETDGIHLLSKTYPIILEYIRTHALTD